MKVYGDILEKSMRTNAPRVYSAGARSSVPEDIRPVRRATPLGHPHNSDYKPDDWFIRWAHAQRATPEPMGRLVVDCAVVSRFVDCRSVRLYVDCWCSLKMPHSYIGIPLYRRSPIYIQVASVPRV